MTCSNRFPGLPLAVFALLATSFGCVHRPPEPGLRMRPVQLPLNTFRLPSGMQIIVEEDHSSPVVGVVAVVSAGTADDPVGKEGLSHLVEHLTFRARPDGKAQRRNLLDYAGAGDVNAITEYDDTVYWEFGPTRALESLIRIEANRLADPLPDVDAKTFEVERDVVLQELSEGDEGKGTSDLMTWVAKAVFPKGHPYARPFAGTHESLAGLTLQDAQKFVKDHYVPSRVTWVIAGDIDLERVKALLDQSLPRTVYAPRGEPVFLPDGTSEETAPEADLPEDAPLPPLERYVSAAVTKPTLYVAWALPPADVTRSSLDELMAGVVEDAAVDWQGKSVESAEAGFIPGERASLLLCGITLKPGADPDAVTRSLLKNVTWSGVARTLADDGWWDYLVNRLKAAEVTELGRAVEPLRHRSVLRATYASTTHDPAALSRALGGIQQLKATQIVDYEEKHLTRAGLHRILVLPNPHVALLKALVSDSAREQAVSAGNRWRSGVSSEERMAPLDEGQVRYPEAAIQALMRPLPADAVQTFTLPTGLEVIGVRRPGWPQISATLAFRGGLADSEPAGAGFLARYAGLVHSENGPAAVSGSRLRRQVARDSMAVQITGGNGNLENVLGLLDDEAEQLGVSHLELDLLEKPLTKLLTEDDAKPTSQAARALRTALYGDAAYGRWTPADVVKQVSQDQVNGWLKRVLQPRNAVLAVAGDFEPTHLREQVEKWLGGWDGEGPALADPVIRWPHRDKAEVIVKGEAGGQQTSVLLACAGQARDRREQLAFELLANILSTGLDVEARQTLGATYGFSGNLRWYRGGVAELSVAGSVANAALTHVLSLVHHAWATMGLIGVSQEALGRAKWSIASRYNLALQPAPALADALARDRLMGLPVGAAIRLPDALLSVTAKDVKDAAARCKADSALVLVGDPAVATPTVKAIWN